MLALQYLYQWSFFDIQIKLVFVGLSFRGGVAESFTDQCSSCRYSKTDAAAQTFQVSWSKKTEKTNPQNVLIRIQLTFF